MAGNKPEKKFVVGNVSVAVFKHTNEKDGKSFDTLSITSPQRSYKVGDKWEHSTYLRVPDLPKARIALQYAEEYCYCGGDEEDEDAPAPLIIPEEKVDAVQTLAINKLVKDFGVDKLKAIEMIKSGKFNLS
jgi:hypothetical protein